MDDVRVKVAYTVQAVYAHDLAILVQAVPRVFAYAADIVKFWFGHRFIGSNF